MTSKLTAAALTSYATFFVGVVGNLLVIPLYLRLLGKETYGLWMVVAGVVTYLGLLNLGVSQTVANRFGAAFHRDDAATSNRICATGFWLYLGLAALAALVLLASWTFLPLTLVVKGTPQLLALAKPVLLVAALCFLAELPFSIFPPCLKLIDRIKEQQLLALLQIVARLTVSLALLALGHGLVAVLVAQSAINVTFHLLAFVALRRALPSVSFSPRWLDGGVRREMTAPSAFYFLLQISSAVAFGTDALVISAILGTASVTPYSIAQKVATSAMGLVTVLAATLVPRVLGAHATGNRAALRSLFARACGLSMATGALVLVALLLLGPRAIAWWVGSTNYVGMLPFVLIVLLAFVQACLAPADSLLMVTGNHHVYALFGAWEAALNLALSIYFVRRFGIAGAVMGSLLARAFGAGPYLIWKSSRLVGWRTA